MDLTFWRWVVGGTVSIVIGHFVLSRGLRLLRLYATGKETVGDKDENDPRGVPAPLIGHIERVFFTLVIALEVSGGATAMIAWLVAKMAVNWGELSKVKEENKEWAHFMPTSLYGGLASMLFALAGGLICRG